MKRVFHQLFSFNLRFYAIPATSINMLSDTAVRYYII